MKKTLIIGSGILAIAALAVVGLAKRGESQPAGAKLVVAMYVPNVDFGSSQAAYTYIQGLAKAIEQRVGQPVDGEVANSYAKAAQADFAILDAQCYAVHQTRFQLLANASSGKSWALYSASGPSMQGLRGKKLAYVKTGCSDKAFIENAMLESEVETSFFSSLVGQSDISGAVAQVASYKGADAVFAPSGSQKGLTKVFDTGSVPGPAFVKVKKSISNAVASKVEAAVTGYGGGGAIGGWSNGSENPYRSLRGRMQTRVKRGIFASPNVVRLDDTDVIVMPDTLDQAGQPAIEQHFQRPPERQE
jgi:hypothetical protein